MRSNSRPTSDAYLLLGDAHYANGADESALRAFGRAREQGAEKLVVLGRAAAALGRLGRAREAAEAHGACIAAGDCSPGRRAALAEQLLAMGRHQEACALLEEILAEAPDDARTWVAAGHAWRAAAAPDQAERCYARALELDPSRRDVRVLRGFSRVAQGKLGSGLLDCEARHRLPKLPFPCRIPEWTVDTPPATVLLWDEQGAGDTIQFVRYARELKRLGHRIILYADSRRLRLLSSCGGFDQTVARGASIPHSDAQVALMSLPAKLGPDSTYSPRVPYLFAEPARVESWAQRITRLAGPRVGLVWQGNPQYREDRTRSPGLGPLLPLITLLADRVTFFSLQKGEGARNLRRHVGLPMIDLGRELDTGEDGFVDTAAAMNCLDLVITSDTSVAHLAGALSIPVWILLCHAPDWRWGMEGSESPWYPSARLFRQLRPGDWDSVVAAIANAMTDDWIDAYAVRSSERVRTVTARHRPIGSELP